MRCTRSILTQLIQRTEYASITHWFKYVLLGSCQPATEAHVARLCEFQNLCVITSRTL